MSAVNYDVEVSNVDTGQVALIVWPELSEDWDPPGQGGANSCDMNRRAPPKLSGRILGFDGVQALDIVGPL